ncbi:MAG: TolC family protein [Gemmatimonadaceae bacterium]|nr:TolC family protein [Gemmatimonadaceae bacterium]
MNTSSIVRHTVRRGPLALARPTLVTIGIGVAILAARAALAQERATPAHLILGDLFRAVERASPRAAAARALARAARARVPAAKTPPDPQLQIGLMNYTIPGFRPMDPIGMTQIQVMQMVPVAGKLGLAGRVASANAAAAAARARDAAWEVRTDAAMAFYDLYETDHGLAIARETLRLVRDIRATAEAMYRVGEGGRQADVLRAQVEVARMVEDTIRMTTMRTAIGARLAALVDRPPDAVVATPVLPVFPDTVMPLDSLVAIAVTARPMVEAGEETVRAADAQTRLARREIWPDLTVGLQYGQRAGAMGTERMASLMLGASLPIFAGRRQLPMREEAAAMQQMATADLAAMRADTRARVTEAYARLVRARSLAALYRTTVIPQAEATAASALAAYRVGSVDFMTLLDDRMAVNAYRQELLALDAEQGRAWAELEMLLGRALFDADRSVRLAADTAAPVKEVR